MTQASEGRASARPGTDPGESLRLGCVKYLNARPLIHGWEGAVDFDHPVNLCRKLAAGELDVALVSSFEFLRNPIYSIVDDVAIASDGPVYSVFVAHHGEMEEVEEIGLDPASLTSVNLLRCLLAERGLTPRLVPDEKKAVPSARLLIGDQAIRFRQRHSQDYRFLDLGDAWRQATALPFVFALWLIRPEVREARVIADRLRARRDANVATLAQLSSEEREFSPEFCQRYFRAFLRFRFAESEKEGLLKFRSLCERHGIVPPNAVPLHFV